MSIPTFALPQGRMAAQPPKKKRVLLVDGSRTKRDLRSETMRKLGMDVDCAADIAEARCWWRADLYDLVLMNVEENAGKREKFCDDVRGAVPPQQIMFLVGKPEYLATSPGMDALAVEEDAVPALWNDVKMALDLGSSPLPQRWGILEACRRISAVRSVSEARTKALRNRPLPPRDSEVSRHPELSEILNHPITENAQ